MELIRKRFPKVRTYLIRRKRRYEVDARGFGIGKRFYYTDRKLALKKADEMALTLQPPNPRPPIPATSGTDLMGGFPIDQIVERIVELLRNPVPRSTPPIKGLLNEWVESKTNDKLKPIRHRTITSLRFMSSRFQDLFEGLPLYEITTSKIESIFSTLEVSPQSFKHYRNYLHQFFSWLNRRGIMDTNPVKNVQVARVNHEVRIYDLEQVRTLLSLAKSPEYQCLIPSLVLGLFGGCRPSEIEQMTWERNIHWDLREVEIQPDITKTKRPRRFKMEPLLVRWLDWFRLVHPQEPLIASNFKRRMDRFKKSLPFQWIPDGIRHSFGTYHYNRDKSLGKVTFVMGNSESVARKHYLTTLPQNDVGLYWGIGPRN